MQTLQDQYAALLKRTHAASEAMKQIESLRPKIEVKNAEIAALQAGLTTCPEGRSKAGLAKRIETLQKNVTKLAESLDTVEKTASVILDLNMPWNPAPASTEEAKPDTEGIERTSATDTEGEPS